ncbi:MAG: GNAT family N-acetyltransferase, partial [Calditrichales bacterium]|nr:GNAT family N-acetyltransferase [Calditrichales bacterium]
MKRVQNITFRLAQKDEIEALGKLFKKVFKRSVGKNELIWRFLENPLLKDKIYNFIALNSQNEIIGHNGFLPTNFTYKGQIYRGALSVTGMADPLYMGIFPLILKQLEDILQNDGFDFLYSFPNGASYPFHKYFKYQDHFFEYLQLSYKDAKQIKSNNLPLIGIF